MASSCSAGQAAPTPSLSPTTAGVVNRLAMAGRPEQPHNVAALVLSGVILVALAAAISSTWVHDGDGTCRALYNPNLARGGCARKLRPTALTAAVLVGAAVLLWDTARRAARRPSRGAALMVAAGVLVICGVFGAQIVGDRLDVARQSPGTAPVPAPTAPPPTAPRPTSTAPKVPPIPAPTVGIPPR